MWSQTNHRSQKTKLSSHLQVESTFSQPNGEVCGKMLAWARDVTRGCEEGDLLELYCGNGNFTIALADNFRCWFFSFNHAPLNVSPEKLVLQKRHTAGSCPSII